MSAPDAKLDPVDVALLATLDAHDHLIETVADWVETAEGLTLRKRRQMRRWAVTAAADIAEMRREILEDAGEAT
jgi:hypothetical protein